MNGDKRLFTVLEARKLVGPDILGRDLAYALARRHGIRLGKRLLIPRSVLEALLEGRLDDLKAHEKTPVGAGV